MILNTTFDAAALAASATLTLLQLVPATNRPIKVREISFSMDGSAAQKPFAFELLIQSTAGTASGVTPVKLSRTDGTTPVTSAQQTFTVEPTPGEVLKRWYVSPQSGLVYTVPDPDGLVIASTERLALRAIVPAAATTVNCVGYIEIEE